MKIRVDKTTSIYRTARPRFNKYIVDGLGRDGYIAQDNGGFWINEKNIKFTPNYPVYHKENYHSLSHMAAPFRYYCDGSGRDSYVKDHDGGLKYDHKPLKTFHLKDFLRVPSDCIYNSRSSSKTKFVGVREYKYNNQLKKIERGLIKRLYTEPHEKEEMYKTAYASNKKKLFAPKLRSYYFDDADKAFAHYKNESFNIENKKDAFDFEKNLKTVCNYELDGFREYKGDRKNFTTGINFYKGANPLPVLPKGKPKMKKKNLEELKLNY